MYGNPTIIVKIKSKRISWLEHVTRMEDDRVVTKLFDGKPGGKKRTRKTKT